MPHLKIAILNLLSSKFDNFPVLWLVFSLALGDSVLDNQLGLPSWIFTKWVKQILNIKLAKKQIILYT